MSRNEAIFKILILAKYFCPNYYKRVMQFTWLQSNTNMQVPWASIPGTWQDKGLICLEFRLSPWFPIPSRTITWSTIYTSEKSHTLVNLPFSLPKHDKRIISRVDSLPEFLLLRLVLRLRSNLYSLLISKALEREEGLLNLGTTLSPDFALHLLHKLKITNASNNTEIVPHPLHWPHPTLLIFLRNDQTEILVRKQSIKSKIHKSQVLKTWFSYK